MLKDKHLFADGSKGYLGLLCPACGYSIEDCKLTQHFKSCPSCARHNAENKLQSRIVITSPTEEVITLGEMGHRALTANNKEKR